MMDTQAARQAWFGAARGLSEARGEALWGRIVALVDEACALDSGWASEVAAPYLAPLAAQLGDMERVAPPRWALARAAGEPAPGWMLARALRVTQGTPNKYEVAVQAAALRSEVLEGLTGLYVGADAGDSPLELWPEVPASVTTMDVWPPKTLRALWARPWWRQITRLTLHQDWRLHRSSALARPMEERLDMSSLRALTVVGEPPTTAELEWLLGQGALESLALRDPKTLTDDAALWLATSPLCASLRALELSGAQLSAHALWVLGASATLDGLERVRFDNQSAPFWELEARAFTRDLRLFKLKELAFVGCGLGPKCVDGLEREAARLPDMALLDVRHNKLSPGELRRLMAAYPQARVEVEGCWGEAGLRGDKTALELRDGEGAPPRILYKLIEEQPAEQWTSIVLGRAATRDLYVEPLLEGRWARLKRLELARHGHDGAKLERGLPRLLSGEQLPALEVLSAEGWALALRDEDGAWPDTLRRVTLRRAALDDQDAARLIAVLPAGLELLDLGDNCLTAEAIEALRAAQPDAEHVFGGNLGLRVLEAARGDGALRLAPYDLSHHKERQAQRRSAAWGRLKWVEVDIVGDAYGDPWPETSGLDTIGRHPHLTALDTLRVKGLDVGYAIDHADFINTILSNLPSGLRRLELRHAFLFHAEHPRRLAAELTHEALEELDVQDSGLSAQDVAQMADALGGNEGLPALRAWWVRGGNAVDEAAIKRLVRARPGLVVR